MRFNPKSTPRWINVDSKSKLRQYIEDQISTNFRVISTYFVDVILPIEKSTSFPRTFFDIISLVKKSKLFPRTYFGVILLVEKSALFPRTFFDVISIVEKSTLSTRTFFGVILLVEKPTLFPLRFNFYGRKIYVVSTVRFLMWFLWSKYPRCFYRLYSTQFWWEKIRHHFW